MKKIFATIVVSLMFTNVFGITFTVDGIKYNTTSNSSVEVTFLGATLFGIAY